MSKHQSNYGDKLKARQDYNLKHFPIKETLDQLMRPPKKKGRKNANLRRKSN